MIDKDKLHDALRQMGKKHVKPQYRDQWTPERPTTGYCYPVAEVVYHYLAPKGSKPYVMETGPNEKHWFIKGPDGNIIDPTADQFDEDERVDYEAGKPQNLRTSQISKRGKMLAELLGLTERD